MEKKKYFYSLILIFLVGALDAYCYMLHDGMFASMQTGNMIKVAIKLAHGDLSNIWSYLLTMLTFAIGIIVAYFIVRKKRGDVISVLVALGCYLIGILIPLGKLNFLANAIMAFGVGAQLQAIREIDGFAVATTMCTGNLRSMSECIGKLVTTKDKKFAHGIFIYGTLIISFIIGVFLGALLIKAVI